MHATRSDLSEWVLHFVHDRDPANAALIDDGQGNLIPLPYCAAEGDPNAEPSELDVRAAQLGLWNTKDAEHELEHDASAMDVLLRILDDGHLRGGWSMRKGRPTIYGLKAACCFAEMPLYALVEYAKQRRDHKSVRPYAIGLPRRELFKAGARHVIYGLSTEHRESGPPPWPRLLAPECGIAVQEQYRYVATRLDRDPPMDWTHEREWRWCDVEDRCTCPGLPIWLADEPISFSEIFVLVPSGDESRQVLEKLKEMLDGGSDGYDHPYRKAAIRATRVLSLDDIPIEQGASPAALRLDDIPAKQVMALTPIEPSPELLQKLPGIVQEAEAAATAAIAAYAAEGQHLDVFGTASLVLASPRSELTQALLRIGKGAVISGIGCLIQLKHPHHSFLLGEDEVATAAALSVFEEHFPAETFYSRSTWD